MTRKDELRGKLAAARERTLWLFDQVPEEFLKRRVHNFYSPIGWHFGHIGRTEEYWVISAALRQPVLDEHLTFLFADLPENPKDARVHLPTREEITSYLSATRSHVLAALAAADLESADPLIADGYGWEFALQHECQHQETIAEMLTLIHKAQGSGLATGAVWPDWKSGVTPEWVTVPGGSFCVGSDDPHGYDNEKSAHLVQVAAFDCAKFKVTAFEWSQFLAQGGYQNPTVWSKEGWDWRCSEDAARPEYWVENGEGYAMFSPIGLRPIHPDEPVSSVSWFEAEAYAKWAGARLLSEPEREFVAAGVESRRYPWGSEMPDGVRCVNGLIQWYAGPVGGHRAGGNPLGIQDLAGGVWEWTSTPFLPYPGFEAFPYDGYSKDHMEGHHRVCRGGSFATADPILRCSFRNWYVPSYRQGFLGLRLARDL